MTIEVEHKDINGNITSRQIPISMLAFIKHMALAGQGYRFNSGTLLRCFGMFLHFGYYLNRSAFNNNRFSEPPALLSDPTEKGQFSTLAGKAIADFLSKQIDHSFFTINYEAAMRANNLKIKGPRPDLIAFTNSSNLAIESKGRMQSNPGNMRKHKLQAQSGRIPVNFSVASVSYNLFRQIRCNYHDPYNADVQYQEDILRDASRQYYKGFASFLNNDYFGYNIIERNTEEFYEIYPAIRSIAKILPDNFPIWPMVYIELVEIFRPRIIIPKNIAQLAAEGLSKETIAFSLDNEKSIYTEDDLYIDHDRIGIRMDGFKP